MDRVAAAGLSIPPGIDAARRLTRFAVAGRYPHFGEDVGPDEWREAAKLAEAVVHWAREVIEKNVEA
jgi:hypothetical protein